ncbi:MAG: hypothetical protein E7158_00075 [Firmicutes bacterium]|nr:hypothetical protein [Bacillota bacterium]
MITLEDNKKYYISKEIENDNVTYVYLTNLEDVTDFCIRKKDGSKENLIGLENEEEVKKALDLYKESFN